MRRQTVAAGIAIVLGAFAAVAGAQHAGHAPDAGGGPHRRVHAAQEEFDRVVAQGLGAGLAFAADQNGYPGPLHVLELKDRLGLTREQETRLEALRNVMFSASRPKSVQLLEAEARLRRLFAEGNADEARVRAAVGDVERTRAELRLVHLLTHLPTRAMLTEEQRRLYHEARWGK
jgi:Spy/CpxP family protein refolding chaperone